jgi:hypothetical protein
MPDFPVTVCPKPGHAGDHAVSPQRSQKFQQDLTSILTDRLPCIC